TPAPQAQRLRTTAPLSKNPFAAGTLRPAAIPFPSLPSLPSPSGETTCSRSTFASGSPPAGPPTPRRAVQTARPAPPPSGQIPVLSCNLASFSQFTYQPNECIIPK